MYTMEQSCEYFVNKIFIPCKMSFFITFSGKIQGYSPLYHR